MPVLPTQGRPSVILSFRIMESQNLKVVWVGRDGAAAVSLGGFFRNSCMLPEKQSASDFCTGDSLNLIFPGLSVAEYSGEDGAVS